MWKEPPAFTKETKFFTGSAPKNLMGLCEGSFALAQFGQILLHGKECYSHCCELLRSSASVGGYFKGKAIPFLRCSQSYFHTGFIPTGSASQEHFGTRQMNRALPVSVVDGKPVNQKHFLLSTFFPKFQ